MAVDRGTIDARLTDDSRHVLRVAAAIGPTFGLHDVAELLGQPVAALLPAIDEAMAQGLIVVCGNDFAFHDHTVWRWMLDAIPRPALHSMRRGRDRAQPATPEGWDVLSDTERIIARLVGDGLTNQQVSNRIYVSPHTVNYHLRRIFRKLDLKSRVELARRLPPPDSRP